MSLDSRAIIVVDQSVVSYSLQPRRLQRAWLPCPCTISWSLLRLMYTESVMPSNNLTPSPPTINLSLHQGLFQ